jgi:hypothetical protein
MDSTNYIHTFDEYLLHVLALVHNQQGEKLCQLLEKTNCYYDNEPTDKNIIIVVGFQVTGIVVLP